MFKRLTMTFRFEIRELGDRAEKALKYTWAASWFLKWRQNLKLVKILSPRVPFYFAIGLISSVDVG